MYCINCYLVANIVWNYFIISLNSKTSDIFIRNLVGAIFLFYNKKPKSKKDDGY